MKQEGRKGGGGERGGGGRGRALQRRRKAKPLSRVFVLVCDCSFEGVLGQNFIEEEEEAQREKKFTKVKKVFRVSLLVVIFYYEVAKAALGGPVQLF